MSKPQPPHQPPAHDAHDDSPADPQRRRLLGGAAAAGAALALGGCRGTLGTAAPTTGAGSAGVDAALARHIGKVVVIFAENRSFNNLFAGFPGLEQPLDQVSPERYLQRDRDGSVLKILPPIWNGMVPHKQNVGHRPYQILEADITGLDNAPWALRTPDGKPLPMGLVTRSPVHRFYENQLQINGGRNDGFVAWGNVGGMLMGYYADSAVNLRMWNLARDYTLCDNFFMGAFGGSFLNHQYLIAARPPHYPAADKSPSKGMVAVLEGDDPTGIRLRQSADSPASAMQGEPKFASHSTLTPDFWVVNTMGPPYAPAFSRDPDRPDYARVDEPYTLPPQAHATIGDTLSAGKVDWAWYAGGWDLALDNRGRDGDSDLFPQSPNFQPHHQPFSYYQRFAPGTAARRKHLRDGGIGNTARHNRFIADIEAGTLPDVAFYKPQGNLNLHAGYADVASGDEHIGYVIEALKKSPHWDQTLVIVTFDENGGWWDHVAPPKADRWGPGTRVPALLISPHVKKGHVEHTIYDTGSIARFLTRRFGLETLPGIAERDAAMQKHSGIRPGDLTEALDLG